LQSKTSSTLLERYVYLSQCPRNNFKLLPDWIRAQVTADRIGITPIDEENTLQAIIISGARVDIVQLYSQVSYVETKSSLVVEEN